MGSVSSSVAFSQRFSSAGIFSHLRAARAETMVFIQSPASSVNAESSVVVGSLASSSGSTVPCTRKRTRAKKNKPGAKAASKVAKDRLVSEGHAPTAAAPQAALESGERKVLPCAVLPEPTHDVKASANGPDETPVKSESFYGTKDAGSSGSSDLWKLPVCPAKLDESILNAMPPMKNPLVKPVQKGSKYNPTPQQTRVCATCGDKVHWKLMEKRYISPPRDAAVEGRCGTTAEIPDVLARQKEDWSNEVYLCVSCVATREGLSLIEAVRFISAKKISPSMLKRIHDYKEAKANVQQIFLMVSESTRDPAPADEWHDVAKDRESMVDGGPLTGTKQRAAIRKATSKLLELTHEQLSNILAPIIDILKFKMISIEAEAMILDKYALWKSATPDVDDPAAMEQYNKDGIKLHADLEDAAAWTSFASKDNPNAWRRAADYSERLVSTVVGAFNYYFICKAGPKDNICWTMINSKNWTQMHEDPIANGQRWYCKVCRAKYMTKFGVLIEVVQPHAVSYMLADFPPNTLGDVRAMAMEREHEGAKSPAELFAAVPNLVPASKLHLQEIDSGIYSITSQAELLACGTFQWAQMFTLQPTKKEQKAINNALWYPQKPAIVEAAEVSPDEEC
jgi:hypothetical protein